MSGRDDDRDERPKLSFSERDKLRADREKGYDTRPKGRWAQAQADRASDEYKRQLDSMFSGGQGGAQGEELAAGMRAAHGTEGFADACRAYRDAVGFPVDPELIGLFLDTGEQELVVGALEMILEGLDAGQLELSKGLKSQVATLAEDFNAAIADVAEEVLERA